MSIWSYLELAAEPAEAIFRALVRPAAVGPLVSADPADLARQLVRFTLDPVQLEILRSPAQYIALCCHRQWGKTQCAALKAVHLALYRPGAEIILVAPSLRQSGTLLRAMHHFFDALQVPVKRDGLNRLSALLPNGSHIVAIPNTSDTIRGFSNVSLIIIDEAAYIKEETYLAVFPFIAASNRNILLLSTPHGQNGFFYRAVHEPKNCFVNFQVRASESQRLSPKFLSMAQLELGEAYAQEFECSFTMGAEQIFDRTLIDQALDPIIQAFR
jgi:hypothetical protein